MRAIYKIFSIIALLGIFSGCEDQLEKDPIGLLTPEQVNTDPTLQSVRSSVTSSYQLLSSTLNIVGQWDWAGGKVLRNDFILQDIASGDMQKKWNPDGDQAWMDEIGSFNFTATNGGFNGIWSYDYEGISRSNLAISYLTNEEIVNKINIDNDLRDRLLGEVYFLRAFYYFDLVLNFGDVPLLTNPLKSFDEAYDVANRVSEDEIWNQIRQDLDDAKQLLPSGKFSSDEEPWRASVGAVLAMQAKVALHNENYQDVIDIVEDLEGLGYYTLNDNYFDNFNVDLEFTENEVIFAYDHRSSETPSNGNGLCALMGWGFIAPTDNFINTFEENDPRLAYTVNVDEQAVYKLLGATDAGFKGNADAPGNKIYIRWADVLLWKAEAHNELGEPQDAIAIINQIRERARNTPTIDGEDVPDGTLPDRDINTTDKDKIHEWLMHERRVELGFESQRFNDLKRWGIAEEVLTEMGKNFQSHNYFYPIPQGEIDKSGGQITQNSGY